MSFLESREIRSETQDVAMSRQNQDSMQQLCYVILRSKREYSLEGDELELNPVKDNEETSPGGQERSKEMFY